MAERLIKAGAKIDVFGGPSLSTPLHLAASYEDTDMVKMLLEYGADPFKKDGDGNLLTLITEILSSRYICLTACCLNKRKTFF